MDETARTIEAMMAEVTLEMFLSDRRLQLAVERALEIVGEAARGISEETRARAPSIPRRAIGQLRAQLRPLWTAPPGPVA